MMLSEALSSAEMYLYRVLQEFRQTAPEHKEWAAAVKACMKGSQGLIKAQCPKGLKWGRSADSAGAATSVGNGSKPSAAAKPAGVAHVTAFVPAVA